MIEPIVGYDDWKLASPPDVEYDPKPSDPCRCGHEFQHHHGADEACWECPKIDQSCKEFCADWSKMKTEFELEG